jgi:mono/diheme cytochrome c family protein
MKATDDGFFISVEATDKAFDVAKTEALLKQAGALSVETCEYETSPARRQLPKGILAFIVVTALLALVPFAFIFKARVSHSDKPHYHVIPDMDFQPKYRAQEGGVGLPPLFADGRVDRVPPAGTVSHDGARIDDFFYRGLITVHENPDTTNPTRAASRVEWAQEFPPSIALDQDTMDRGQKVYGIYCRPCHGDTGDGKGMINVRAQKIGAGQTGWNPPTNLTDDVVIRQPHGQIFNTITHGIRTMPGYGSQISVEDRWSVVLYLRALQRSRKTTPSDLPESLRGTLR